MAATARTPPFRADHIGSLLRPAPLRQAFRDFDAGRIDAATFEQLQDEAIRKVVKLQEDIGFEVVNDGEYRRGSYWSRFVQITRGFALKEALFRFHDDHGHETGFTVPHVVSKVSRERPIAVDEVAFVRRITNAAVKVTLPAPSTMHFWRASQYADPGVYDEVTEFLADLAKVYQAELRELAAAGASYVQLDEVAVPMLCDPAIRERLARDGQDAARLLDLYIDAINRAVAGRPVGLALGVHMCRGNYKGQYLAEGGYDCVAEAFFQRTEVDHFLLEYDSPRAGDLGPLRFVPHSKGVVLGLVSSKRGTLESQEELVHRVQEASRYVDLDRLALSPQCGFASTVAGNPVTEEQMREKLTLVVQTARILWGR